MSAPDAVLRDLRASLARIERVTGGDATPPPINLSPSIDDHLPGGGLARGALHEVQASDLGAGLALCTLILSRTDGPVLWIGAHAEGVWAPGLHALGLRADRLLLASYRQPADGLWTMEEALRSPAFGGVVLQLDRVDMTASRRLQLAAEGSPRVGLLLRNVAEHGPSNAVSRWRVASMADATAQPRWRLDLLRCRAGRPGSWDVRWGRGALEVEEAATAEYA